ncbi:MULTISPECIES: peptidyl-prolyl cis-trans isomerase [Ramlibacter]|uniref:Peptidyl-prolyl cis-trans isomerase n=1 Tax=Ramlibacter pinisoli TaxID=2682844 RepID=A0A6N8J097_9BURK|nr:MULTISPECIES: peptidylprolyl isomerase [Ramlibacter]MBA2961730.1 peptidyl-prolyl cis-trans isomerase [Ramlibacter sp. CGMCC 1.13660]MVQ31673.1 peptidyl-prolyl cis-trans isomerase [Ramlibacter pinisoli]
MTPSDRLPTPPWFAKLLREPLFHFVVLGALVFGADAALTAVRGGERDIAVPAAVRKEARDTFVGAARREPSEAEMRQFLARWIDNEILYREGLALGLDKGDPAMRERVIFKALNVVQAGIVLPPIDEAGLAAWFEANRKRYDVPARISFEEAVPAGEAPPPENLRKFVDALNGQGTPALEASLRSFKQRPRETVVEAYGEKFAHALEDLAPGTWAVLDSGGGLRAVRLQERTAGRTASYADVRDIVYQDWKDDMAGKLTAQAVRELGRKYRVRGGSGA